MRCNPQTPDGDSSAGVSNKFLVLGGGARCDAAYRTWGVMHRKPNRPEHQEKSDGVSSMC